MSIGAQLDFARRGGRGCLTRAVFRYAVAIVLTVTSLYVSSAEASPFRQDESDSAKGPRWVSHRVLPGERLKEIGARYAVSVAAIIRWNKLDEKKPLIRVNQKLRIRANIVPPARERVVYTVRKGDSWYKIAKHFKIGVKQLYRWNPKAPRSLRAGQRLIAWIEPEPPEPGEGVEERPTPPPPLPVIPVRRTAVSIGTPDRGRLFRGVQLPENKELYTIRNPNNSWGTSHAIENLQLAIARFRRDTGYDRELVICDMSRKGGGRFPPHMSHRSGRDVDIRLPLRRGVKPGTVPKCIGDVDWDAAWGLVQALIQTSQVKYIFLSRSRQKFLYRAAKRAGADDSLLNAVIQFPRGERVAVVRHDSGHVKHIHVRFKCAEHEPLCRD